MQRASMLTFAAWLLFGVSFAHAQGSLIVHEWGTITTRHSRDGTPQGRLNRIDPEEVLPAFVHKFEPPQTGVPAPAQFGKGTNTPGRPDITMRLETPVLYFYRDTYAAPPAAFDVGVQLRGGILNEFYPDARASIARDEGRIASKMTAQVIKPGDPIVLDNYLIGRLAWNGISLNSAARPPQTGSAIWNAPRNVRAERLSTAAGEGEHYLFYRGVAHLDALLRTRNSPSEVQLSAPQHLHWMSAPEMTIPQLWLVDVRADGAIAFAAHEQLTIAKHAPSAHLADIKKFSAEQYGHAQVAALREKMRSALINAGLYDDEAEAMLATWNASYFQRAGLRIFYVVPREWIEYFMPLELSVPHRATRVMIGRIDLID